MECVPEPRAGHGAPGRAELVRVCLPQVKDMVAWCEANVKNLTAVDIGPGLHFVQEDRPHEIGEAIRNWYDGLTSKG